MQFLCTRLRILKFSFGTFSWSPSSYSIQTQIKGKSVQLLWAVLSPSHTKNQKEGQESQYAMHIMNLKPSINSHLCLYQIQPPSKSSGFNEKLSVQHTPKRVETQACQLTLSDELTLMYSTYNKNPQASTRSSWSTTHPRKSKLKRVEWGRSLCIQQRGLLETIRYNYFFWLGTEATFDSDIDLLQ